MAQQDIQEFNRVLFEALEASFRQGKRSRALTKELYEGELVHFTKCLECLHESQRQEKYQDIILILKNIYQKVYSGSLELSLQRYVKPEQLDADNTFDCGACGKRVLVERGVKFASMPPLLNLVIQRFHFDYETFQRNKMNDKMTFPFVLNFNHYFNGYDLIPNKLSEDSSQHFLQEEFEFKKPAPKPKVIKTRVVNKSGTTATQPAVAGKTKTKPSANTKSFLQEMRKKKMQQQLGENEDLIYLSGSAPPPTATTTQSTPIAQQT